MLAESSLEKAKDMKKYGVFLIILMLGLVMATQAKSQTKEENRTINDSLQTPEDSLSRTSPLSLSFYEYEVVDTAEYITFRLYVRNTSDSLVVIDRVEPSCGCILATIQKSFVRTEKDGEIYIGLSTKRMSDSQPYTLDVYTTMNPESPMRLYIRRKERTKNEDPTTIENEQ